jgi:hypothetical protein
VEELIKYWLWIEDVRYNGTQTEMEKEIFQFIWLKNQEIRGIY